MLRRMALILVLVFLSGCAKTIKDLPLKTDYSLNASGGIALGIYGGETYFPYRDWGESDDVIVHRLGEKELFQSVVRVPPRYVSSGGFVKSPPAPMSTEEVRALQQRHEIDLLLFYRVDFHENRAPVDGAPGGRKKVGHGPSAFKGRVRTDAMVVKLQCMLIDPNDDNKVCKVWESERIVSEFQYAGDGPVRSWDPQKRVKPCEWSQEELSVRDKLLKACADELAGKLGQWLNGACPVMASLPMTASATH